MNKIFDSIENAKISCKNTFKSGLLQIGMRLENIKRTDFKTKHVQVEYPTISMKVCNTSATPPTVLNEILNNPFVSFSMLYTYNFLILSKHKEVLDMHMKVFRDRSEIDICSNLTIIEILQREY